jgi:hypothetical protein
VALTKSGPLGIALVAVELVVIVLVRQLGFARRARTLGSALRREMKEELKAKYDRDQGGVS